MSRTQKIAYTIFIVALGGFLDAAYLTMQHYGKMIPPCQPPWDCEAVLTSAYATIQGIPISLFGMLYYITAAVLAMVIVMKGKSLATTLLTVLIGSAFVVTVILLGLQQFVIGAYCLYCLVSAVITTVLFILLLMLRKSPVLQSDIQN